jgi:hypothetical protein
MKLLIRVWDNLKKEWCDNKLIWRIKTDENGVGEIVAPYIFFKQDPHGFTKQMFIGVKDKKGQNIFEGDIISFDYEEEGKEPCMAGTPMVSEGWEVYYNEYYTGFRMRRNIRRTEWKIDRYPNGHE